MHGGDVSQSEQWAAGQRIQKHHDNGQGVVILHLGDHDPSGIDMSRDNQDRLTLFSGVDVPVIRLALNRNQIDQYNPPPNPAKLTDSRAHEYIKKHGRSSWELDALDPPVIERLIETAINTVIDKPLFEQAKQEQLEARKQLETAAENWSQVQEFIETL